VSGTDRRAPMTVDALQHLIDQIAIENVLVECALAQDRHDWDGVAGCFEPDAVYLHPKGQIDGSAGIAERSRAALGALDASQHLIGSIQIEITADTARATSYFHAQHVRAGAPGGDLFVISGTYADVLQRRDGVWRISERRQSYSARWGNPEVIVR
jgi:ketosteroid isomerase-like protein